MYSLIELELRVKFSAGQSPLSVGARHPVRPNPRLIRQQDQAGIFSELYWVSRVRCGSGQRWPESHVLSATKRHFGLVAGRSGNPERLVTKSGLLAGAREVKKRKETDVHAN